MVIVAEDTKSKSSDTTKKVRYEKRKIKIAYGACMQHKNQYGFVAQELEQVLPNLVSTDSSGLKSVNYIAVIPLLVEAIKEQNAKIESLEADVKKLKKGNKNNARSDSEKAEPEPTSTAFLYQNTPNPFTVETQIKYFLPNSVSQAAIYIYDLNGKQLKSLTIENKGESSVTLKAQELHSGLYIYALVADGRVIDTKKMIIVE